MCSICRKGYVEMNSKEGKLLLCTGWGVGGPLQTGQDLHGYQLLYGAEL